MKNFKIGKKITISFGVVIGIMIILAAVILFTNTMTIQNVGYIDLNANLQTETNNALDSFNAARTQASVVYNVIEEKENAEYLRIADATEAQFQSVFAFLNANPILDVFRPDIQTAYDTFVHWRQEVQNLIDTYALLAVRQQDINAAGGELADVSTLLLTDQFAKLAEEDETDTRRVERLTTATQIYGKIANFRMEIRTFLQTRDTTLLDGIVVNMEDTIQMAEGYKVDSVQAADKANAQTIIDAIISYRDSALGFGVACDEIDVAVVGAIAEGETAVAAMVKAVGDISASMSGQVTNTSNSSIVALIIVVVLVIAALALAVVMARILIKSITPPLIVMRDVAKQVGETGNLHFTEEVREGFLNYSATKDEVGETMASFSQLITRLREVGRAMETVANKDLTIDVNLLSEEDLMGNSLALMIENLNDMFGQIHNVANEVASSSGEIANGAQILAQGSTEQASTVEEVSASVFEINTQMDKNAETANNAARYGEEINGIANEGTQKLGQMMEAVQEINESASEIGKVIKVIDDIAFQTNILALNAAVEAARAGEHGKGFAVVADEVRNLAAKSADAAKETAELISASIEKSEVGLVISQETSESLGKIIEGIQKTSESLQNIADESEASKAATEQVKMAIDQVAQVVQQNSATSEESAASSEELNSMASALQSLVAQFKLKQSLINL